MIYPRTGAKWHSTEDHNLMLMWCDLQLSVDLISDLLGRSSKAVRMRIQQLGLKKCRRTVPDKMMKVRPNNPPDDLIVDLISNTMCRNKRIIRLSPGEAELMHILIEPSSAPLATPYISRRLWGASDGPPCEYRVIHERIRNLRKKIKPLDLTITSVRNHGYVLENGSIL